MNSIEERVLQTIGESTSSPDVFLDTAAGLALIRGSVNDAIEEIAMVTGSLRDTFYLPLREGRTFYRFDDLGQAGDVAWITDVFVTTNRRRLEQTDFLKLLKSNPRFLIDSGSPVCYFPIGLEYLGIWPKPGGDTDILEIIAVMIPYRYSADTDRIKVRQDLEWAAVHYAVGEYFISRGDAKQAIIHHQNYLDALSIDLPFHTSAQYHGLKTQKEPWPVNQTI